MCENSTHTVVKTVRMRRAALEQWIGDTDIKVGDDDHDDVIDRVDTVDSTLGEGPTRSN